MDYTKATNDQLQAIFDSDNHCPTHLLSGVVLEMINRRLLDGIIFFAATKTFKNVVYVLEQILKIEDQDLIQIAHIQILKRLEGFKPGTRTAKTYLIMCLCSKFSVMLRDAQADKRKSNLRNTQVDALPEYVQTRIFRGNANVEKEVINKIMIEDALSKMKVNERKAILLELMGYPYNEIKIMLGYHPNANLVSKAHKNLRVLLGA